MSPRKIVEKIFTNILRYSEDKDSGTLVFHTSPTMERKNKSIPFKKLRELAEALKTDDIELVPQNTRARDLTFNEVEVRGVRF